MTVFEFSVSHESARRLMERADELGLTVEELCDRIVDNLLDHSTAQFTDIATRLLLKNQELYRRLAN